MRKESNGSNSCRKQLYLLDSQLLFRFFLIKETVFIIMLTSHTFTDICIVLHVLFQFKK